MLAGQKSYGTNGKQNFLFPLPDMYMTQGSYEYTYSHDGIYAMDFQSFNSAGSLIHNAPMYAPFDCHCMGVWSPQANAPAVVWQSDDVVNFIDGSVDYATIIFVHDNDTLNFHAGDTRKQGDLIAHTGTKGTTADHIHIECKKGAYLGFHQASSGAWGLTGATYMSNLLGINNTIIKRDYYINHAGQTIHYNWREFSDSPTPPIPSFIKGKKFPWVLYAKKIRKRINV